MSCDDEKACTTDVCDPVKGCDHLLQASKCLIEGQCYGENAVNPGSACMSCIPGRSTSSWTTCGSGGVCFLGSCCAPACGGKKCGDDGCGGDCGTCQPMMKCDVSGQCVSGSGCTNLPSSWGRIGAVSALQTPPDATVVKTTCFDYTGDGNGDNAQAIQGCWCVTGTPRPHAAADRRSR